MESMHSKPAYVWAEGSNDVEKILQHGYVFVCKMKVECGQRRYSGVRHRDQRHPLPIKGAEVWEEWISTDGRITDRHEVVIVEPPLDIRVATDVPDTASVTPKFLPLSLVEVSLE